MPRFRLAVLCAAIVCIAPLAPADEFSSPLRWTFDSVPDDAPHDTLIGTLVGNARTKPIGPSADHFAGMPEVNQALLLDGQGDYLRIADDAGGRLDFDLGQSITIEAWVRAEQINSGQNVYLIGKGRTHLADEKDNQNYALRLRGVGQSACVSFLFRSAADNDAKSDWHRWTSKIGFRPDGQWHHVAVSYTFGKPTSIRGYLDGEVVSGTWDMGGATERGPVIDDDELWIGSSMGGSAGNSLHGAIDEVAIHRGIVPKDQLKDRRVIIERPPSIAAESFNSHTVAVALHEHAGSHLEWPVRMSDPTVSYQQTAFGFSEIPVPYGPGGVRRDWDGAVMMIASATVEVPKGKTHWMVRAGGLSRLWIDDEVVIRTPPHLTNSDGHGEVEAYAVDDPWLRPPRAGHHEQIADHTCDQTGPVRIILQTMIGGEDLRYEPGEILVAYRTHQRDPWQVLSVAELIPLTDQGWTRYQRRLESTIAVINDQQRRKAASADDEYWTARHRQASEFAKSLPTFEHNSIDEFVNAKISEADVLVSDLVDDDAFIRRLFLDCTGVIPTVTEIESLKKTSGGRDAWIDQVLSDPRWADHWTVYWMDVLAENPNILKASLNNTGPFRWFLYDMMRDNVPVDRWVTNLIRMEGSAKDGGPAGFGIATQNDVPMAAKAHVLSSAFLSNNMKCARCHDAPYHDWTQRDLFSIAAMLANKPVTVPETSSVPDQFFSGDDQNSSLITVTLKPGEKVTPRWPLDHDVADDQWQHLSLGRSDSPRERLAFHMTRPQNQRFAATMVNRLWRQLLGEAIVEPVDDWEGADPSHPELLSYLARELTASGYDFKHVAKLIFKSETYQRIAVDRPITQDEDKRYFESPRRRRMTAEQVVDSLHVAVGRSMECDELTFDPEARMKPTALGSLGRPKRAWQFASLSNERDRPALSLPRAGAVCECLEAFGWNGTRQEPINHRPDQANVLQPAILASGLLSIQLTRLTDEDELTSVCVAAESPQQLVDHLFTRFLGRPATSLEQKQFVGLLEKGFLSRVLTTPSSQETPIREAFVSWANHLNPEATQIRLREVERLRNGPPASGRLTTQWRERAEDVVWALINTPEFQFIP